MVCKPLYCVKQFCFKIKVKVKKSYGALRIMLLRVKHHSHQINKLILVQNPSGVTLE